jgi:2-polyprenyl-6-methoxyphenol hydroxylase-like FAD-dependent oxidoreductase
VTKIATAKPEVLIVGAGSTGLMLAALLTGFGMTLRTIDSNAGSSMICKATSVQAGSLEAFRQPGLFDKAVPQGLSGYAVNLYNGVGSGACRSAFRASTKARFRIS